MLSAAVHISATVAGGAPVCTSMSHNFDCTLWFKKTRHQNNFTDVLRRKFATKSCLNIPPRLKCVATLPCQIYMLEKWRHSKIFIVINNKSQCSITKHLRNDELLYYAFIIQSASERIFRIGEHLAKLQAKWFIVSCTPFALHFCPQRCWSRQ